jgi:hypothetical protein
MVLLVAAAALALALSLRRAEPTTVGPKPTLLLLTSLPLIFNEEFSLQGGGSPAMTALESRFHVVPVSTTSSDELDHRRLLLMAHPLAQTAENLVALDDWVRDGGRVLLLADPRLEWPSKRPLGDPLRPPPMFMDTGLLAHWGLRLDAPDEVGPVRLGGGHNPVVYLSPGRLTSRNPACELSRAGIIAECAIGKGRATVVADADFINADVVEKYGGSADNQMKELLELLESLNRS